jgi:hypothetical protein
MGFSTAGLRMDELKTQIVSVFNFFGIPHLDSDYDTDGQSLFGLPSAGYQYRGDIVGNQTDSNQTYAVAVIAILVFIHVDTFGTEQETIAKIWDMQSALLDPKWWQDFGQIYTYDEGGEPTALTETELNASIYSFSMGVRVVLTP